MFATITERLGRAASITPIVLTPLLLSALAFDAPTRQGPAPAPEAVGDPMLDDFEDRLAIIDEGLRRADGWYVQEVEPVERVLRPFHPDERWVRRIALALVREGRQTGMDPRALASVLLVENPWLDADIQSFMGAVGLMQVMPFHAGRWGCASDDLTDVETNICHGSRIFARYLDRHGDVDRALLAYNGCVRGTNTPNCHLYPNHVYSRAGRAAMQRWLKVED